MIAADVCRRCWGWLSIGPTLEVERLTDAGSTFIVRTPDGFGDYEHPRFGCRCREGTHPPTSARLIQDEFVAWMDNLGLGPWQDHLRNHY